MIFHIARAPAVRFIFFFVGGGHVAVSFKIIMTTSVTRPCFTTQHQTCKNRTKTDFFLVWDWSCPKTDGVRPHHCCTCI